MIEILKEEMNVALKEIKEKIIKKWTKSINSLKNSKEVKGKKVLKEMNKTFKT